MATNTSASAEQTPLSPLEHHRSKRPTTVCSPPPPCKQILLLLLLTLAAEVLIDSGIWNYPVGIALLKGLYGWVFLSLLFSCLACLKYAGMLISALFGAVLGVLLYAKWAFGYDWSPDLILATFTTTWQETSAFVNIPSVAIVLLCAAFFGGLTWLYTRLLWSNRFSLRGLILTALLVTAWWYLPLAALSWRPSLVLKFSNNEVRQDYTFYITMHRGLCRQNWQAPFNSIGRSAQVIAAYLNPPPFDKVEKLPSRLKSHAPLTFVLVIGESMRADHFGIHGYARQTTPLLARRKLIPLHKMYSYGNSTYPSLVCLLTGEPAQYGATPCRSSFLALLGKHGYRTNLFLENTIDFTQAGSTMFAPVGAYLDGKEIVKGDMGKVIQRVQSCLVPNDKSQMIVIENGTGHFPYQHHAAYSFFQPCNFRWNDVIQGHEQEILNDYDNCVRAVDILLDGLIRTLENRNAVLVFVSDHGQHLGEGGRWIHGNSITPSERENIRHVASFIWLSDDFRCQNPEMAARLESLSNKPLSHSYFFKSILSLCGIEVEIPGLDLDFTQPPGESAPVSAGCPASPS